MAKKNNQEKSLTLVNGTFTAKQLLTILQKTPQNHIYTRPAKGGGEWEYVTGVYVKKVLNYVFGWMWDFQIVDKGREGDLIWVQGRLTIRDKKGEPKIIKEQFGRADIKFKRGTKIPLDYGNDLKAAATDALKKCASELGIASDVYGKNEFKEIQMETKPNDDYIRLKKLINNIQDKKQLLNYKKGVEKSKNLTQEQKVKIIKIIKEKL